jgi:hypothetical protein
MAGGLGRPSGNDVSAAHAPERRRLIVLAQSKGPRQAYAWSSPNTRNRQRRSTSAPHPWSEPTRKLGAPGERAPRPRHTTPHEGAQRHLGRLVPGDQGALRECSRRKLGGLVNKERRPDSTGRLNGRTHSPEDGRRGRHRGREDRWRKQLTADRSCALCPRSQANPQARLRPTGAFNGPCGHSASPVRG